MKKLLLLLVASVLAVMGAKADDAPSTLVATLSHEGKMLAYYGKEALKDAYNAARDGDVITLSSGTFSVGDMNKNIVIRGCGMKADARTDNGATFLDGAFTIQLQDNDHEFMIEGVNFYHYIYVYSSTTKQITFSKCGFNGALQLHDSNVYAKLFHCFVKDAVYLYQGVLQNSHINRICNDKGKTPLVIQNCSINRWWTDLSYPSYVSEATLTNCLIIGNGTRTFSSNDNVHNCVGLSLNAPNDDFFTNCTNNTNKMVADRDNFFKDSSLLIKNTDQYGDVTGYTQNWSDISLDGTGLYELSDEAAKIYTGNDGTVVGVWGGSTPFSITPSNPRLTKCDIVPKVDASGKLSVTIEVAQ